MKKVGLLTVVFLTSFAANAQSVVQDPSKSGNKEYSLFWGMFKSKDYPKGKSAVFEIGKPKLSTSLSGSPVDTTRYEKKNILWGAIQWTEKKKDTKPVKSQKNEK